MKKTLIVLLLTILSTCRPLTAAERVHAGVAANYIQVFKELAADFESKTAIRVEATFTSSGSLYGQITNGAPYDIFLSADGERPERLFNDGIAEKPFIYAKGQVILWSAHRELCTGKEWTDALKSDSVKKISIANINTAPYGMAAMKALQSAGLSEKIKAKLINSQDIAQAFQYASTGAVDAGFCALSAVYTAEGKQGCYYIVKEAPSVVQSACIIKNARNRKPAERFAAYLVSKDAEKIRSKYGYR